MPVTRAGGQPGVSSGQNIRTPAGSIWRSSPSLEQARAGRGLIKRGQAGQSVLQVQQLLNAAGTRPPLETDGLFGQRTQVAVRRFQAQHGLSQDGIVGPQTLGALQGGGAVERPSSAPRRSFFTSIFGSNTGRSAERAPRLGAETPARATGVHGLLSGNGRLTRSDINWNSPRIRPPGGRVSKPSAEAFTAAVNAYDHAKQKGEVRNHKMTLIDMSRPSNEPRMWVIDMDSKQLLAQHLVTHGSGSDTSRDGRSATRFSDRSQSHQTSLGTYITAETYTGRHGRSLKLDGKEGGFNRNARSRAIVMHEADYASAAFLRQNGYLGRSWGCPAMDPAIAQDVISMVKGGSAMLIYSNSPEYLQRSAYVRG